jgi:hypothetical protein
MDKAFGFGFNRAEMRCLCLLAVVLVSGCAGFELNSTDPNAVASGVTRTSDPYTQVTKISARPIPMVLDFPNTATAYLVAFEGRRREVDLVVQCVFSNGAGGGRSLHQTFDSHGTELETKVVSQDQNDYAVTESIAITLSRAYLVSHAQSGLDMKLIGDTGAVIIKIPAAYVQGFLFALKS